MHLKTHFKFLFYSSKISTSWAHVIIFLNTRLHCDSTKISLTPFGSTTLEIQKSQNSITKLHLKSIQKFYELLTGGSRGVNGSTGQSQPKHGRSLTGHCSTTARSPARGVAPTCSARCPAPTGVENGPPSYRGGGRRRQWWLRRHCARYASQLRPWRSDLSLA